MYNLNNDLRLTLCFANSSSYNWPPALPYTSTSSSSTQWRCFFFSLVNIFLFFCLLPRTHHLISYLHIRGLRRHSRLQCTFDVPNSLYTLHIHRCNIVDNNIAWPCVRHWTCTRMSNSFFVLNGNKTTNKNAKPRFKAHTILFISCRIRVCVHRYNTHAQNNKTFCNNNLE